MRDRIRPTTPTTMRMTPIVLMSMPDTVALTAQVRIAPAAIRTAVALLVPWLPPAAGKEASRIHFVYWFTTAICIAVFAVVASVLTYSVWKFRARPDDDSDGPPIHGHTTIEIVWTAVPA